MNEFHAAAMSQDLKDVMRLSDNWQSIRPDVRESLDRVQSAIGRILAGEDGAKVSDILAEALEVGGGKTMKPDKKIIWNNLLTKREKWLVVEGFFAGYIKAEAPMPKNGIGSLANEWLSEYGATAITKEMILATKAPNE
jgi:hypothetical protein